MSDPDDHKPATEVLTLRDYFAAKVLEGIFHYGSSDSSMSRDEWTVHRCYEIADAMLKERAK